MEGSRPTDRPTGDRMISSQRRRDDALDTPPHIGGSAAGKRQEQEALRVRPVDDQVRDAVGQRRRLPRTGSGKDKERPTDDRTWPSDAVLDPAALFGIERPQMAQ